MSENLVNSLATITEPVKGEFHLAGCIDYRNGKQLYLAGQKLIQATSATVLVLDCSAVVKSSSVGLSLILSFIRVANAVNKSLVINSLPEDIDEIAKFSGVFELLPLMDTFKLIPKTHKGEKIC